MGSATAGRFQNVEAMVSVHIEENNSILTVKLNRPDVRNAFDDQMIADLTKCFREVSKNTSLRALLLRGEGESFCAGADLNWMKSMVNFGMDENVKDSQKLHDMFAAMEKVSVPIVGQIHGHAMGGALGLVALCDIVAAEKSTQFCFSEVKLGLAPAVISPFVIRKLSRTQINRFFLTAELFTADQALSMDFIHFSGSMAQVEEFIEKMLKKIRKNGPMAVRKTKELISKVYQSPNPAVTTHLISELRVSDEGQEGLKAFFEKRKPNWIE